MHLDVAFGGMREPEQQPKRRRLPGTVGTDQSDPPARDLERQVIERGRPRIALGESVDAEQGCGVHDGDSLTPCARNERCERAVP